jgi:hypothetical protein
MITHGMGVLYPGACTSIHMNMLVRINPAVDTATLTEAERVDVKEDATFRQFETGTQPCLQDTPSDHWIATVIRGQVGGGQEQSPAAAAAAAAAAAGSSGRRPAAVGGAADSAGASARPAPPRQHRPAG